MYPNTMPPIRFGIKNTVRKKLVPFFPRVRIIAIVNAKKLIVITETIVNFTVNQSALINSLFDLNALM
jgi:hypothetical protein